jgi:hypothetical protein
MIILSIVFISIEYGFILFPLKGITLFVILFYILYIHSSIMHTRVHLHITFIYILRLSAYIYLLCRNYKILKMFKQNSLVISVLLRNYICGYHTARTSHLDYKYT